MLGSGNLGLVYLMEEKRRLTLEEIDERHPELIPALREHPHVGWLLVRSAEHGAVVLGADGAHYLDEGRVEGEDPLAPFSPTAPRHLLRTDGFAHVADIMVGSFYDPDARRGLRVRGADLLPRRPRRPADAPVHPRTRRGCRCRTSRSSAPPPCTTCSRAGARMLQGAPAERARLAGATPGGGQQLGSELAESRGVDEVAGEQPAATP